MYYRAGSFLGSWEAVCTIFCREAVWNIVLVGCLHFYRSIALHVFFGCITVAFRIKSDTSSFLGAIGFLCCRI